MKFHLEPKRHLWCTTQKHGAREASLRPKTQHQRAKRAILKTSKQLSISNQYMEDISQANLPSYWFS